MKQTATLLKITDIAHVHLKHNFLYINLINKVFNCDCKIILHDHSHNFHPKTFKSKISLFLLKTILKPQYYIGVSKENCNWAEFHLKINKKHIYKLTNFVAKEKLINSQKKIKNSYVLVSNISRIKNIEFAIKLISKLNGTLTIIGNIYDATYYNELTNLIEQLNLKSKVYFAHKIQNVQQEINKYEFALLTSLKETGPLVVIEYLAQEIPFLTYDTGEVIQTIKKELPTNIINNFNIKEWAERIDEIKKNNVKKNYLTAYNNYFTSDKYLKECTKIYNQIQPF